MLEHQGGKLQSGIPAFTKTSYNHIRLRINKTKNMSAQESDRSKFK